MSKSKNGWQGIHMNLKKVTLVLIVSMIASFTIRTFGTLFPRIFYLSEMVKATVLINAFFILVHLLFWMFFYKETISAETPALKKPGILAIVGSFAVSILYLKKVVIVFDAGMGFSPLMTNPYVDASVPLISSSVHLIFFVLFKKALKTEALSSLKNPVISMIGGISIYMVLHAIVLIHFVLAGRFEWLEHMPRPVAVGTMPLVVVAVCLMLYFYLRLYGFLTGRDLCKNPRHDPE